MNALAGHAPIECCCGVTVLVRIIGVDRAERRDGLTVITPLLDHTLLTAHFKTHQSG